MVSQTNFFSKTAARVAPSDDWGKINRFLAPYPIGVTLALIANGAKHRLLAKLLNFDDFHFKSLDEVNQLMDRLVHKVWCDHTPTGGPWVVYSSRGWVDSHLPLKHSYKHAVQTVYKDVVHHVDYGTKNIRLEVNHWAQKETCGLITDLIPQSHSHDIDRTTLVFTSSLHFRGVWHEKFDPSHTQNHPFHLLDGNTVQVPFITSKKKQYIKEFSNCKVPFKVLSVPYKQGHGTNFSMLIFLPNEPDKLSDFMYFLAEDEHKFIGDHLPHHQVEVGEFRFPRFKVSEGDCNEEFLRKALKTCPPFDLTGMVDPPVGRTFNSSVSFSNCSIEVNEGGTTTAGATATLVNLHYLKKPVKKLGLAGCGGSTKKRSLASNEKVNFVADHPFFAFIRENKNGVVGFMGFVVNPRLRT